MFMTWKCHVCKEERPDNKISVYSKDTSSEYGLPMGTMIMNIRYCNDRESCIENAPYYSFISKSRHSNENVGSKSKVVMR